MTSPCLFVIEMMRRMRYNRGDIEGAADAFLMWTKAAGRVLPGLVKRRNDERALFLRQDFPLV